MYISDDALDRYYAHAHPGCPSPFDDNYCTGEIVQEEDPSYYDWCDSACKAAREEDF